MNKLKYALVCVASCILVAGAAFADVNYGFDADAPESSVGFIGRGDIISLMGKESLVNDPVVTIEQSATYEVVLQWETGVKTKKIHTNKRKYKIGLDGVVLANPRKAPGNGNITGYILGDCTVDGESGSVPQVGDVILDNDNIRKVVVEVIPVGSPSDGEVLRFFDGVKTGSWLLDSEGIGTAIGCE